MQTFSLADGKYEIVRDDNGLITDFKRNGEPWPVGLKDLEFSGVFHAALNRINELETLVNGRNEGIIHG